MNTLEEKIARIPVPGYARRHDGYPNPLLKREVDARTSVCLALRP